MSDLKTYAHVNRTDENAMFGISRMEDIYEKRNGQPDEPHRHDFFTVLFSRLANGKHVIDFHAYDLLENQVFFVSPGQVHQVIENEKPTGYSIVFSSDFLAANNIPVSFIHDLNLFRDYGETPPLQPNKEQVFQLSQYCEDLLKFYESDMAFQQRAIASVLELFLIYCNNICSTPENTHQAQAGNTTLKDFKRQVEEHFTTEHSTSFYAGLLHITPDHLNRTVKSLIGKTAKEYIQSRITIAAKRMLMFTDLSNKEIGYELGFSEPANFSAFFKKCTKKSPTQFRDSQSA